MALYNLLFLSFYISVVLSNSYNYSGSDVVTENYSESKLLSRRKRFLIYPEGSSLQLVFCLTYPMIFEIGDIFLYGYTAALAWELPQDPYSPFNHKADPLHRRVDSKMIYFTNDKGKVLWGKKYHRKPIVNPAMAKRSLRKNKLADRKLMHASQHKREFLKREHMDVRTTELHRLARASLYPKIETMLQAMGRNGRDCVLRTLCQVGKTQHQPQGSFLEEIMRAVFTLPKGSHSEELIEYDEAHSAVEPCAVLYPDCDEIAAAGQLSTHSY